MVHLPWQYLGLPEYCDYEAGSTLLQLSLDGNMPTLLFSISCLTKVQVIDWHPLLVVESMFRLQVHLLVAVSYVVIQMTNVTSTKYLESSWDPC